jgi:hypothetical protein
MNYLDVCDGSGRLLATKHLNCSLAAIHSSGFVFWLMSIECVTKKKKKAERKEKRDQNFK